MSKFTSPFSKINEIEPSRTFDQVMSGVLINQKVKAASPALIITVERPRVKRESGRVIRVRSGRAKELKRAKIRPERRQKARSSVAEKKKR